MHFIHVDELLPRGPGVEVVSDLAFFDERRVVFTVKVAHDPAEGGFAVSLLPRPDKGSGEEFCAGMLERIGEPAAEPREEGWFFREHLFEVFVEQGDVAANGGDVRGKPGVEVALEESGLAGFVNEPLGGCAGFGIEPR